MITFLEQVEQLQQENAKLRATLTEIANYDVVAHRQGWAAAVHEIKRMARETLGWDVDNGNS